MKKMLLLMSLFAVTLTSCEKKEDNKIDDKPTTNTKTEVVGTWTSQDAGYRTYEDGVLTDDVTSSDDFTLELKSDNTFKFSGKYDVYNQGTYTYSNDQIELAGDTEDQTLEVISLSETELVVEYTDEYTLLGKDIKDVYYFYYTK